MNGLFALFCDDVDSEAFCPNEGSCCVTGTSEDTKQEVVTTTRRPATPVSVSSFSVPVRFNTNRLFYSLHCRVVPDSVC